MENPSYYAIIPANVRYDKSLSANEKLLYGEITALCNKTGRCWATNKYFAELYNVSIKTISVWIKSLKELNYIYSQIIYKEGGMEIEKRYLSIIPNHENVIRTTHENVNSPTNENVMDNNINLNNINLNKDIIINNNTENPKKSGNSDINNLIQVIKEKVKEYGLAYDNTQERMFARHILIGKDFGNFAESIGKSRDELCISVINASIQINYFRGPCTGPKSIYKLYSDVYNQRMSKRGGASQSNVLVI